MEINKIYNENCIETMAKMPDNFIDLTVTSPPYDNLRDYKGYTFNFEPIAKELYRVTKQGGVIVWVVADQTINGSETGTSFRQALYFKEIGFNLHDTMIYLKPGFTATGTLNYRYGSVFEYMFILSKDLVKTFNPIKDRRNKHAGTKLHGNIRQKNGDMREVSNKEKLYNTYGQRFNVWKINPQANSGLINHPAQFPEKLANDHIISWSNPQDLIYDPFMGSGTTGKMAILNNRNYIGSEISPEYCLMAEERIQKQKDKMNQDLFYSQEIFC